MRNKHRGIADAFRLALDREDWPAAGQLLAADCQYELQGKTITGVGNIIASYADNAAWARDNLDEISYESQIAQTAEGTFSILFTDHLRAGDARHTFQCRQEITVGYSGKIVRITHQELPSQRAKLDAFFERCGLSRP